jgi:FtsZ-interacting cell division protein ZipA
MTKQISAIAGVACIALSAFGVPAVLAKQQCSAAMPSDVHGHWWSYRLIDGRKCWYEGKPGLSKSLLEWPAQAKSLEPKSVEPKSVEPRSAEAKTTETKPTHAKAVEAKTGDVKTGDAKTGDAKTVEAKPAPAKSAQEKTVEANAQHESKKERAGAVKEKSHNPLDSQAWAPTDQDTFETRWRARVIQQHPIDPTIPEK